jgi:hypothetical protein
VFHTCLTHWSHIHVNITTLISNIRHKLHELPSPDQHLVATYLCWIYLHKSCSQVQVNHMTLEHRITKILMNNKTNNTVALGKWRFSTLPKLQHQLWEFYWCKQKIAIHFEIAENHIKSKISKTSITVNLIPQSRYFLNTTGWYSGGGGITGKMWKTELNSIHNCTLKYRGKVFWRTKPFNEVRSLYLLRTCQHYVFPSSVWQHALM